MIRLCIFDMDGTLLDTERKLYIECEKIVCKKRNVDFDIEFTRSLMGSSFDLHERMLKEKYGEDFPAKEFVDEVFENVQEKVNKGEIYLRPGAIEILEYLKSKSIKTCIASSCLKELGEKYLKTVGIDKYFDYFVFGNEVINGKPHPEIYLKAQEHFGIPKEECLIFEDAHMGALSAYNSGIKFILIPDLAHLDVDDLANAFMVVSQIDKAIPIIESLNGEKMNNKKIFRIKPIFEERMWGGTQLIEKYNLETDLTKIAEIYSVIAIPGHLDCVVEGTNEFLSDFYHNHPNVFKCDAIELPVRVVLGSSKAPLSVQIHPDDDYGLTHSNMRGKHEGELLLSGHEGNYMILGHYAKTREEFIRLAEEERWDELLRKVEVKPYDYIHIPYNTLHGSVGEGTCVAFSTNGDVTYRLYDYDRIDPKTGQKRQLHKQDVYNNVICPCNNIGPVDYITKEENGCRLNCFFDEPGLYTAGRITVEKVGFFKRKEFMFITCLSGKGIIEGLPIKGAETLLIPADYGEICIKGKVELVYITSRNR